MEIDTRPQAGAAQARVTNLVEELAITEKGLLAPLDALQHPERKSSRWGVRA